MIRWNTLRQDKELGRSSTLCHDWRYNGEDGNTFQRSEDRHLHFIVVAIMVKLASLCMQYGSPNDIKAGRTRCSIESTGSSTSQQVGRTAKDRCEAVNVLLIII